jgi:chromosome segregation ATPase
MTGKSEANAKGGLRKTLQDLKVNVKKHGEEMRNLLPQIDQQFKMISTRINKNDSFLTTIDGRLQNMEMNMRQFVANQNRLIEQTGKFEERLKVLEESAEIEITDEELEELNDDEEVEGFTENVTKAKKEIKEAI